MSNIIKELLLKIVDSIDAGNSSLSEEESIKILEYLKRVTDKDQRISKYEACRHLNVSRATFDNYIRAGKLPKGKHQAGFKELSWSEKELDDFIKSNKC